MCGAHEVIDMSHELSSVICHLSSVIFALRDFVSMPCAQYLRVCVCVCVWVIRMW